MRRLYAFLIRLFPRSFREQFGRDMAAQIGEDHERAWAAGRWAGLWFSVATSADLVRCALAERWDPAWDDESKQATERSRRMGWLTGGWSADLRQALRSLRRTPGFTVVAVVTLGLAIGANAGIFSVVDTVLLDALPYPEADRLVYIAASAPGSDFPEEFGVSAEFIVQYSEESRLLENVAAYNAFTATLRVGDRAERVPMSAPTVTLFETLGAKPILGRLPTPEDEDRVAVISYALWASWFGSDPEVIGRSYSMIGADREVIGVMGPEFRFPDDDVLLWVPAVVRAADIVPGRFGARLVGRMTPDATREGLVQELTVLARRLPERFGGSPGYARLIEQHRPIVRPLRDELTGDVSRALWVLLGSVGIVLLIACANVANLFMVRAERRQRDLAIRRAIGAGRAHLFRSQMAESVMVALLAGVLAVVLARVSVPVFVRAAPPNIPRLGDVTITPPTLLFTLGICILSALLCGLLPAIRSSVPNLTRLRDGSRGSTRRRHWARDGLVVAQTALALVLLIGSGLLVRSFNALRSVDPGYDTHDIFTFQIAPEGNDLTDAASFARFHVGFMDRIRALPGVESVGLVENVPLNEGVASTRFFTEDAAGDTDAGSMVGYTWAGGDYFRTMGIDVLSGRAFTYADNESDLGNVIVSRAAADLLWPGENPIGRQVRRQDRETWEAVVGVVEDVMQYGFRDDPQPLVYFALVEQAPASRAISSPAYVVKTARAASIAPEIRDLVRQVRPEAPMYRIYTMDGLAADSMVQLSFTMLTLGITSLLALILGMIGLYGVLSYIVAERTREIGVRMALGARAAQVRRMVVSQGARVVVIGVLIGVPAALATTRALRGLLFGVETADAATFVGMSTAMLLVGLLASYVPARRASVVDPIQSLRD